MVLRVVELFDLVLCFIGISDLLQRKLYLGVVKADNGYAVLEIGLLLEHIVCLFLGLAADIYIVDKGICKEHALVLHHTHDIRYRKTQHYRAQQ